MSNRMGSKIAFVTAATFIVAACSKEEAPQETPPPAPVAEETVAPVEQPKTIEEQLLETYGSPDQTGLDRHLGDLAGADRVYFAYDSSELSDDGRALLEVAAKWLMAGSGYSRVSLTIEGHCDERGTREYNLALGDRRANAVKNYLEALGVPASRLGTISYGKERPVVAGSDEASHAQNRRAVLRIS